MTVTPRRLCVLAAAVALLAVAAMPAAAVQPFGPTRWLPPLDTQCTAGLLVGGTTTRAFGTCERRDQQGNDQRDRLAYYQLTRDGWDGRVLSILGRPVAAAQDETGTYLLFELHRDNESWAAVLRRDPRGAYSTRTLSRDGDIGSGSLVVRKGKWWAVWTCVRGGGREYSLCEAGTLYGSTPARQITDDAAGDYAPHLALRTDGQLDLMWNRSAQTTEGSDEQIWLARKTGDGWNARVLRYRTDHWFFGELGTDGRHEFATWVQNSHPVIASDESGSWVVHELPTRSCAYASHLAVSAGVVTLLVGQCAQGDADEGPEGSAVVVLERRNGRWTTTSLDRRTSETGLRIAGVVSHHGRATVLLASNDGAMMQSRSQAP